MSSGGTGKTLKAKHQPLGGMTRKEGGENPHPAKVATETDKGEHGRDGKNREKKRKGAENG